MTEFAPQQRCPFFSIAKTMLRDPGSDRPMILPLYHCQKLTGQASSPEGQPHVAYGPDGSPVSPQNCSLQRYETQCKHYLNEAVEISRSSDPKRENPSATIGFRWVREHSDLLGQLR